MSTCQASPHVPTNSSGFQKASMPKLQITSDDEEANIWAKMAKRKQHKALREEAAQLEAERLKREWEQEQLEAKRQEQEHLEAKRKEQEWLEAEHWEQETQAQQKTGEPKGKEQEKAARQSKWKKRTCNWCTEMKVRCELPEGVEPEAEEARAKAGKKRAPEDVMLLRAREKRKVTRVGSAIPGESEASPLGVVMPTVPPSDPLVAVVVKGFKLIAAAMDQQMAEMWARRETQHWFNSWLGDLLGEFEFVLRPTTPVSKSSEELHSDVADMELESLQSD
ncbi:hypothetical protein M404DRAFT_25010 [Pisolithus tinctorius Marx 270]|uniref:Uncharacterized protein n=1 Tax=Pisolithus tinctorius Marx 270 TaxID=870435 RepID=A0A0C3PCE4_PISTI|nr:hypothetical protein M404DRAFT_25010 [Pisolithus tinctorius Marx 270]